MESDITLNGEYVTSKTAVNTISYIYDSEGSLSKKEITSSDGNSFVYDYESNDGNQVLKFTAGNQKITSHSKSDSFGRKVFDELQLGTGFVSRQFSYYAGEITAEHKANAKLKSTATTQLVSQIILSDGRTLSYEYDEEERITKVTDSLENTTTEYTYDALGQLLTETVNGTVVNTMTYDNYGNIISKNGKLYTYDYEWQDRLYCYDGTSIYYDNQGNPTDYLGHALTWEKGRQLKTFDSNTYTYNANGIRTSKTVGGVKHTYILDGTKILRESWGNNTLIPLYDNEDSVCGIIYNNEPYYFYKNLQGDIVSIVDKDAEPVARYTYDAWGVPTVTYDNSACSIATVNPFRYRSYYYDEEIAKYYLQSRYYDPALGRFINSDEALYLYATDSATSCNLFCYCNNECSNNTDISGFASVDGFLKHIKKLFQSIPNFVSKAFAYLKNKFTPFKIEKNRWGEFLHINTWLITSIIDVTITLISKAVSLGLKGLVSLIKGLVKSFKNQAVKIIKNSILPFFKKSILPFLKNFVKKLAVKMGISIGKDIVITFTDRNLPNTGTICAWLLESLSSAGSFISFLLDLSDSNLDDYYSVKLN